MGETLLMLRGEQTVQLPTQQFVSTLTMLRRITMLKIQLHKRNRASQLALFRLFSFLLIASMLISPIGAFAAPAKSDLFSTNGTTIAPPWCGTPPEVPEWITTLPDGSNATDSAVVSRIFPYMPSPAPLLTSRRGATGEWMLKSSVNQRVARICIWSRSMRLTHPNNERTTRPGRTSARSP